MFNGNCREVMTFYKECFGGELTMLPVGDSPMKDQWPAAMQDHILHAMLVKDGLVLSASDVSQQEGKPEKGNMLCLSLNCQTEEELHTCFKNLSAGGTVTRPIHDFFAGKIAALTDKFGFDWIFHYGKDGE